MTPRLFTDIQGAEGEVLGAYPDPDSPLGQACARRGLHPQDWKRLPGGETLDGAPWTIGYGHTGPEIHPGLTWTSSQAEAALHLDVARAVAALDAHLPWWRRLDDVRQDGLAELCFNMGLGEAGEPARPGRGLRSFVQMLSALEAGRYAQAAEALMASRWAKEVGARAGRIEHMLRTGARQTP